MKTPKQQREHDRKWQAAKQASRECVKVAREHGADSHQAKLMWMRKEAMWREVGI